MTCQSPRIRCLCLKGCGPKGYPGMAEVGNMPIPAKLVKEGVRDMVRVSDARMSGTAFGTVILHVTPEAQEGGTLAFVKTGDRIRVSAAKGILELLVGREEIDKRRRKLDTYTVSLYSWLCKNVLRSCAAGGSRC